MNNSENLAWNTLHKGSRVPINDTDVDGAPFNLNGNTPQWQEGSINKAVYDTHIISGGSYDVEDVNHAENLTLSFLPQLRYINNDMLYGYQEDARNTIPGSFMSFRGYPTATLAHSLIVAEPSTATPVNIDGSIDESASGLYTMFFYNIVSTYKMPYDVEFTATITIGGVEIYTGYVYRILKGFNNITHYRDPSLDEEIDGEEVQYWEAVNEGIYISVYNSDLTGDIVCDIDAVVIAQSPFYGTLGALQETVTESEYDPVIPAPATAIDISPLRGTPLDGSLDLSTIALYSTRTEKCNEFITDEIYPRLQRNGALYMKDTDTLQVGVKLYSNDTATEDAIRVPGDVGAYFWKKSSYFTLATGTIWKLTRYLILDENSIVTYLDEPGTGYLGEGCWVEGL